MLDRPTVLYVDDQKGNLLVFKSSMKEYFEVRTAGSGQEGLEILEKEEIPVVIADQRMPGMSGSEFLAEVRKRRPDTMRMVMTAYTNFDDVVKAINDGQVTRYIQKPWETSDLLAAIRQAVTLYFQIKENRSLTEQLLHKQRLAAIGQVTSGLVHELSNIATVLSSVDDLEECLKMKADPTDVVFLLKSGVEKFSVLLEGLRVFSKGGDELKLIRKQENLNDVVEKSIRFLRLFEPVKLLREIKFEHGAEPVVAPVDRKKLEQVIINIAKNAAEAAPRGIGVVKISVGAEDQFAVIRISDNGPGIPDAAANAIWQGFYSTKGTIGTGLGLMMSKKIIDAHAGNIAFANNKEGGGCMFTLKLPLEFARS
jgi:two-component system, sensor histidine kinase and response regulator